MNITTIPPRLAAVDGMAIAPKAPPAIMWRTGAQLAQGLITAWRNAATPADMAIACAAFIEAVASASPSPAQFHAALQAEMRRQTRVL